ncbi:MAG: trimethylamine methyltransferase family protein [Chloroflexi bacterium]|nr:trimethylamine methyltransferase family protein [Chloroflexota bacterium]
MIKGLLRIVDDEGMNRIHQAALQVLETTGLIIRGRFLLEALAGAGCRVDFEKQRAWFRPDLVERQIEAQRNRYRLVRSSLWYPFCKALPEEDAAWPDEFIVDYGFTTPSIYDYPEGMYRLPAAQDQIDMIKLGDALEPVKAVNAPFICADFDPAVESIETARLLLLHTNKPGWVGVSDPRQVKYLAEFGALALQVWGREDREWAFRTQPPMFAHAYCTTSPLKIDTHPCRVLAEALKYKFPVNFAPMPILGGTTPVTPAGSAVIATAEILGCVTACSLIEPDLFYFATAISGEMDMKTTQVCYATPAAILTDTVLHQLFRFKYGMVLNVEPAYLEAKCPGMQAAFMKTYRQMALAAMVSAPLPIGLLDNGAAFSATQAMLDLDMNRAQYKLGQGVVVDDDTLCVDLINRLVFCEQEAYIQSDHTLTHFRDILWDARYFDRTYRREQQYRPQDADRRLLDRADQDWRRLVREHVSPVRDAAFMAELERIAQAARTEMLG